MRIPPPPVPARLREMLKDYPELAQELQEALNGIVQKMLGGTATPPFERALWTLEDTLSGFISQARRELEAAKASGDPQAVAKAEEKERLMFRARSGNGGLKGLHELGDYFDANQGAFK